MKNWEVLMMMMMMMMMMMSASKKILDKRSLNTLQMTF